MATVCLIGLPRQLRDRVRQLSGGRFEVVELLVGASRRGRNEYDLNPIVAKQMLEQWWERDQDGLRILLLPYTRLPDEIAEMVATLEALNVPVMRVSANQHGWPAHPPNGRADERFLEDLFERIESELALGDEAQSDVPPVSGETRFYKKIAGSGAGDKVVRTNGCIHNKWTPAHRADRAVMGIERASGGTIATLSRCPKCTGGGHWRVVFE